MIVDAHRRDLQLEVAEPCRGRRWRISAFSSPRAAGGSAARGTRCRRITARWRSTAACCGSTSSQSSCCSTSDSGSSSSCCSPASNAMELVEAGDPDLVLWDTGYTAEQISLVPVEAANLSLGCGNPTAMASLKPGETVLDIGSGAGIDAFYAAKRVGPDGHVIGLDMTPAMIERARQVGRGSRAEAG